MVDRLHVHNYKSLVDFELINIPNFCVFAGPNASGKSNIFEALQFLAYLIPVLGTGYKHFPPDGVEEEKMAGYYLKSSVVSAFGGMQDILNKNAVRQNAFDFSSDDRELSINIDIDGERFGYDLLVGFEEKEDKFSSKSYTPIDFSFKTRKEVEKNLASVLYRYNSSFLRLFVDNENVTKEKNNSNQKLASDASNLGKVLDRLLKEEAKREQIFEWLDLLIPEFESIKTEKGPDGSSFYFVKERNTEEWFGPDLISDGTKAILAILVAVFQSDEPQFLCIEEPENGLNPYVQRSLVDFFRTMCEDYGHTIWLNTHSQTIVSQLNPGDLVLVNKEDGITKAKHITADTNLHGLSMDEAWLSNALGGGVPW
ncbi:MAG: AAA family ATPase [Bacteroidetes bacterium]|nr:AAA family ATPase [Bacteroidota bacterium]